MSVIEWINNCDEECEDFENGFIQIFLKRGLSDEEWAEAERIDSEIDYDGDVDMDDIIRIEQARGWINSSNNPALIAYLESLS